MRINQKPERVFTHEGGVASRITPFEELKRSVMSCMLWEDGFYESGEDIATRISKLISAVDPDKTKALAVEAKTKMKLRHTPLANVERIFVILNRWPSETLHAAI